MHLSAKREAQKFVSKYCTEGKVLDIGSMDVNGCLKDLFEGYDYTGMDMAEGKNVDVIGTSHDIPFEDNTFDVIVSTSCFEHDDMFWVSFLEMCRVLKPGGKMYINAPSNGPEHRFPVDNWRFYQDSWKALEKWGRRNKQKVVLLDSYIATPNNDGGFAWKDSIGIYEKAQ